MIKTEKEPKTYKITLFLEGGLNTTLEITTKDIKEELLDLVRKKWLNIWKTTQKVVVINTNKIISIKTEEMN